MGFVTALLTCTIGWLLVDIQATPLLYHLPLARVGEFALGVALGVQMRDGWRPTWARLWWSVPAAIVVMTVCVRPTRDKH